MRVTIDRSCDMGYIYLEDKVVSDHTIEVKDKQGHTAFVMDINSDGHLVGIEVFGASKRLSFSLYKTAEDITGPIYEADVGCWEVGKKIELKAVNRDEAYEEAHKRIGESPLMDGENPHVVQIYENGKIIWDFWCFGKTWKDA